MSHNILHITVVCDESPEVSVNNISDSTLDVINEMLKDKRQSNKLQSEKDKPIQDTIKLLLDNPCGVSPEELLETAQAGNLSSLVLKIRNRLSKLGKTLEKDKHRGEITYYVKEGSKGAFNA